MEIWKAIDRFGGVIEASNLGRIRRIDSRVNCRGGKTRLAPGRILTARRHPWGYDWFEFSVGGKKYWDLGHRLVAEAFLGKCPPGNYVLHFDNNPNNNKVENLRYGTPTENCSDKLMHGTQRTGEQIPWHKLTEKEVVDIRTRRHLDDTLANIAIDYGISEVYVWQICTGKKWPNAGGPIEEKRRKVNILSEYAKQRVIQLRVEQKFGIKKLATIFGVSNTQIHNLVRNHENKIANATK